MKAPSVLFQRSAFVREVFSGALVLSLAWAATVAVPALEPGAVDPGFNPPASVAGPHLNIYRIGGHLYLVDGPVSRVRDNGQPDDAWRPPQSESGAYGSMAALPAGGYLAREPFGSMTVVRENGVVARWRGLPYGGPDEPVYPQPDGSVLLPAPGRVNADGTVDTRYGLLSVLESAPFADGSGLSMSGLLFTTAAPDRRGRLIVGGNFVRSGGRDHLGLVRLGPDGTPDTGWNPAAALGVTVQAGGLLTAVPASLAVGPQDSVYVGLRGRAVAGQARFSLARVNEAGLVEAAWPWRWVPRYRLGVQSLVQPDARVLVGARPIEGGVGAGGAETGVVRLNPDGSLDSSFSVELRGGVIGVSSMALDASGWLWVAGDFTSINGVARPGLARVRAYSPTPRVPEIQVAYARPRVGTNEVLELVASVVGSPEPALQWYRNDVAVPGATNVGLRVAVANAASLGEFRLVATNAQGRGEQVFPAAALAVRSTGPGVLEPGWDRSMAPFPRVTQLLPLRDGRIVVASGPDESGTPGDVAVIGRLLEDGSLDRSFGGVGYLRGDGTVEQVQALPDGGLLLAGRFSRLGRTPAAGLAELNPDGTVRPRAFPDADVPQFTAALALSDGRVMVAGRFSRLGNRSQFRVARLRADLSVDPDFAVTLEPWQLVDTFAVDGAGRLLIGGERLHFTGVLTNPPLVGLQRLLPDGQRDPSFRVSTGAVRRVFVEPGGTLLAGLPYRRVGPDGEPITTFEALPATTWLGRFLDPDFRSDRLPDGGVVAGVSARPSGYELVRWGADGWRDRTFRCVLSAQTAGPMVEAVAALEDGSVLVATRELSVLGSTPIPPERARRLIRIAPDSDTRLTNVSVSDGRLRAWLPTQPHREYEVVRRNAVVGGLDESVATLEGDGYEQSVSTPAAGDQLFLELRRR